MKIRSLKFAIAAIGIVAFALILKSCKKVENTSNNTSSPAISDQVLSALRDSLKLHPELASVVIPINEKVPAAFYYGDGKRIFDSSGNLIVYTGAAARPEYVYTCAVHPPFPAVSNYATLSTVTQNYDCNKGYSYTVTWIASSPVNFVVQSPYGAGYVSTGVVEMANIGGGTSYSNTTITPVITPGGTDPADQTGTNRLFTIVYTTPYIPFSYSLVNNVPYYPKFSILLYTDCTSSNSYYSSAWSSGNIVGSATLTNPCNRIDPIIVSPYATGPNASPSLIFGFGVITGQNGCSTPPNGNYPSRQEIQFAYAGATAPSTMPSNLNFHDIRPQPTSTAYPSWSTPGISQGGFGTITLPAQAGTINPFDAYTIPNWDLYNSATTAPPAATPANPPTALHGYYYVKWRDCMFTTTTPLTETCTGSWSSPAGPYLF